MKDVIHFYRVKDLEKVKLFYEEIMDFSLYKDQKKCLIYDVKFGKIGFCEHFPEHENTQTCITFVDKNKAEVEQKYLLLKSKKIVVEKPKENEKFKIYHFFAEDFNGLKLEFQTFL